MSLKSEEIIAILKPFVSEHKQNLVEEISRRRTRHITLVFEDIDKPHNISAVLRTAECMGIQDIHFIKNQNNYQVNPDITKGAAKWLTLYHHKDGASGIDNIKNTYDHLRSAGYKIYGTSLAKGAASLNDLDIGEKTAIVFGTEGTGISEEASKGADGLIQIPMKGFTESYNLSVSAAIILNTLIQNDSENWMLTDEERQDLTAEWYKRIVREADKILALKQ
ncbi:MAG: RNA methyltransferase [Cytophagales bacterium]|nr:RNA methyltransferase [Cytophagales bacterium]